MFGDTKCEIAVSPPPRDGRPFMAWAMVVADDGRLCPVTLDGRIVRGEFDTADSALRCVGSMLVTLFGEPRASLTRLD